MKRHLVIGIPSYDGKVVSDFNDSYVQTVNLLMNRGIPVEAIRKDGCCYIDQARDEICHGFLNVFKEATDLLFVDADMGWNPEDVLKLLDSKYEVRCGMYPWKQAEPKFTLNFKGLDINDGWMRAKATPAGFMMVSRSALEKMRDAHPELVYNSQDTFKGEEITSFFHMYIKDKAKYREDIAFGMRWSDIGDGVWINLSIRPRHWEGHTCYDHSFARHLQGVINRIRSQKDEADQEAGADGVEEPYDAGHQSDGESRFRVELR